MEGSEEIHGTVLDKMYFQTNIRCSGFLGKDLNEYEKDDLIKIINILFDRQHKIEQSELDNLERWIPKK